MALGAAELEALANRFFAAVEAGDLDGIVACYNPGIRVWHARDEADTDIEQSKELLRLFIQRVSDRRYEIIRRHFFEGGWVQEHITHGRMNADGSVMRLPVCFIAHVDDQGKILRIAEYFNAAKSPLKDVVQHHVS